MTGDEHAADPVAAAAADVIFAGFRAYRARFHEVTRGAKVRFEQRAWLAGEQAGVTRLDLYTIALARVVEGIRSKLSGEAPTADLWRRIKHAYVALIKELPDYELAETFFNSIHRELSTNAAIDETQMFVWSELDEPLHAPPTPIYTSHVLTND